MRKLSKLVLAILMLVGAARGAETEFMEKFAYGDRTEALKSLVPGTEDYYYYNVLHLHLTGKLDQADKVISDWKARFRHSGRAKLAERRAKLLRYDRSPDVALSFIKKELGLHFGHSRIPITARKDRAVRGPSTLDPKPFAAENLINTYLKNDPRGLGNIKAEGLYLLAERKLTPDQRRVLLNRIEDPGFPGLVKLILADLAYKHSGGFGSLKSHKVLTLAQLDEIAKARPKLLSDNRYVNPYLKRLAPADNINIAENDKARAAWLERLERFTDTLPTTWNSTRAQILYSRLVHERALGNYDLKRFKKYLDLPCRGRIGISPLLVKSSKSGELVSLSSRTISDLPPISSDSDLVLDYLNNFLRKAKDPSEFSKYFKEDYLKRVFAEIKVLAGQGNPEEWAAVLGAPRLRQLRDRVELSFSAQNRTVLAARDKLELKLRIKNVKRLILRVHEINTKNFYRQNLREVTENENLDGIVPAIEKIIDIGGSPYVRNERTVALKEIKGPGVYIAELIGGSLKARAIIRRGQLYALPRTTSLGHVLSIFDGAGKQSAKATVWMDGQEYKSAKDGLVYLPFSSSPGKRKIVISSGGVSSLGQFQHLGENFRLECGFHLMRESLIPGATASLLIRPQLLVNGQPAALSRIASSDGREPKVQLTLHNADGSTSTHTIRKVSMLEGRETELTFPVRNEIVRADFHLSCKVKSAITNRHVDLSDSGSFSTARLRKSARLAFMNLDRDDKGYHLRLLGRNGEPRPGVGVTVSLVLRCFSGHKYQSLVTDANGAVRLGELKDVTSIYVTSPLSEHMSFRLDRFNTAMPTNLELRAGEKTLLAWPLDYTSRARPALLALRGGEVWQDFSNTVKLTTGYIELPALQPGSYRLLPSASLPARSITVVAGRPVGRILVDENLAVEMPRRQPLLLNSVKTGAKDIEIQLNRGGDFVRVHVLASRFLPAYDVLNDLDLSGAPGAMRMDIQSPRSIYLSGVGIDGEYRYILERRFATKFPGNMLERPSLLLCPWDISESDSGVAPGGVGGYGYRGKGGRKRATRRYGGSPATSTSGDNSLFNPVDYLASLPVVLSNLSPDKKGRVRVPLKDLGGLNCVEIVIVDPENLVRKRIYLPSKKIATRDLRMRSRKDYAKHFSRHNAINSLDAGKKMPLDGLDRVAIYSSLEEIWTLYSSLLPGGRDKKHLNDFAFLRRWPELKEDKRLELYSKYASHELNFYLYNKDRKFFAAVIKPHLANKIDVTFMDEWLLGRDLGSYLRPDRFAKLNAAERALLTRKVRDRAAAIRAEGDRVSSIPLNFPRLDGLFDRALGALALTQGSAANGMPVIADESLDADDHFETAGIGGGRHLRKAPAKPSAAPRAPREKSKKRDVFKSLAGKAGYYADKKEQKDMAKALYRQVETTKVWAESNWFRLRRSSEHPGRVPASRFWSEFANHDGKNGFISGHIAETATTFSEAMMALAVLDLPVSAKAAAKEVSGPAIVYSRTETETPAPKDATALSIVQRYFDPSNRYETVGGQKIEKYVDSALLYRKVYGCVVTAMNASPRTYRTETLLELPAGAIPVSGSQYTQTPTRMLRPYSTGRWTYYFYFPETGRFTHYGGHLSTRKGLLAFAEPNGVEVKNSLPADPASPWMLVSQDGTDKEVLAYMSKNNVNSLDLNLIAFRMKNKKFFLQTLALLRQRRTYVNTLWSYSVAHNDRTSMREYLQHTNLLRRVGPAFDSTLLTFDPIEQITWEHLEFSPLINSRAHPINGKRHITSGEQKRQFLSTLTVMAHKKTLTPNEKLVVVYHLLLQDRIEEALKQFAGVSRKSVRGTMQYDYLDAYVSLYREDVKRAGKIAAGYKDYSVPRWRKRFAQVLAQVAEINGDTGKVTEGRDRLQQQSELASKEPGFSFVLEGDGIKVSHKNLSFFQVNFYLVDLELLFSRKPFSYLDTSRLAAVRATDSLIVKLQPGGNTTSVAIPAKLRGKNLVVEVAAAGKRHAEAAFSRAIRAEISENYGQVRVVSSDKNKPLPKAYIKVYGKSGNGKARFIKDGYTDLRGRFEYATVSGLNINNFSKLAILVVAEDGSALVREVKPPRD